MSRKLKRGKKSGLVYFNYADIQSWSPCNDSKKHISDTWRGTAVDLLKRDDIPFSDRLWCAMRTAVCSERLMRLAAVWFYRDTLNWVTNPDPQSIEAANIAERFANGEATLEELSAAESAAWSARLAAWSVRSERSAAESAAWSAIESAAKSAVWSAEAAAESAAWLAEASAAWSAESAAAWLAVRSAAQKRYADKLIEMLLIEGREKVKK